MTVCQQYLVVTQMLHLEMGQPRNEFGNILCYDGL